MHTGSAGRAHRIAFAVTAGLACLVVVLGVVPALADPTYPSEEEIDEAREAERTAGDAVAAAEARLAEISDDLDRLHIAAAKAVEVYNGARVRLTEADEAEAHARDRARMAAEEAADARAVLSRVVSASYRHGGELARVGLVLRAEDSEALYDTAAALQSATATQAGMLREAMAAISAAETAAGEARAAVEERERAAQRAEEAADTAGRLVAEQEQAIADAEAEREALLEELAAARGTTVALEEARKQGIAEEQAAERERAAAREQAAASRSGPSEPTDEPTDEPAPDEPTNGASDTPSEPTPTPEPSRSATSSPAPTPAASSTTTKPAPSSPPDSPTGAQAAVEYAYAQVGKPYEWGADGPDSFDCSGLTMRAWEAGGKSLPHWSVAQAEAVVRIPYLQMRPGDLIFWSDNGQPSGVHHVGLYIGDGQMIHAPRSGKDVEVQSVFYWYDPAFYGRVP